MATKADVIDTNLKNPTWTARQIADELGCTAQYVHKCKELYGLVIPRSECWRDSKAGQRMRLA